MVDVTLIQPASQVAAAIGVCIAAIYYVMTLRVQQANMKTTLETRQAQLFKELFKDFVNEESWKNYQEINTVWKWSDYDDFILKYGPSNLPEWNKLILTAAPFEEMGVLMNHGVFDPQMMYDQAGGWIIEFWERVEGVFHEWRIRNNVWEFFVYFEDLYYAMKKLELEAISGYKIKFDGRLAQRRKLRLNDTPFYADIAGGKEYKAK